ncbi:hypothetical protein X975_13917, partial [Stegodyphus mimosarum]
MSTRDLYGTGVTGGQPIPRSAKPSRRLDMPGGYGMSQSSPPVTTKIYPSASISQPPSARASPVSGRPSTSPQSRKGRHFGISRSSNSSPLTLPTLGDPGGNLPHSCSIGGFGGEDYFVIGEDPMMDGRGMVHRSRSATRTPLRGTYQILDRDPERDIVGMGR